MTRARIGSAAILGLLVVVGSAGMARAGEPAIVNPSGRAYRWPGGSVTYNPDRGPLGTLSNEQARDRLRQAFETWAVPGSSLQTFYEGDLLREDVTGDNYPQYSYAADRRCAERGRNPVIFDSDGRITDAILGADVSSYVSGFGGFGSMYCVFFGEAEINNAEIDLNGRWIDGVSGPDEPEVSLDVFQALLVHEAGHFLNIGHTQVGLVEALDNDPLNDGLVPIMFPLNTAFTVLPFGRPTDPALRVDDVAAVLRLYGSDDGTGTITGQVRLSDGRTAFQGAHVIARRVDDPRGVAVGSVSGTRYRPQDGYDRPDASLRGHYDLVGLPPGTYTVEVEQIYPSTGVFRIGPPDRANLPGVAEYWNGDNESGDGAIDDPSRSETVEVRRGQTVAGIDFVLNDSRPPAFQGCDGALLIDNVPARVTVDTTSVPLDGFSDCGDVRIAPNRVWFTVRSPRDVAVTVSTAGSSYETAVGVYDGDCSTDACEGHRGPFRLSLRADESKTIAIGQLNGGGGGTLVLSLDEGDCVACSGDCDGDGRTAITDLVLMVNIALGSAPASGCADGDRNHDGVITISDLLAAVASSIGACSASCDA